MKRLPTNTKRILHSPFTLTDGHTLASGVDDAETEKLVFVFPRRIQRKQPIPLERTLPSKHLCARVVGSGDSFHSLQLVNPYVSLQCREENQ